jgi:hypothetical protein
MLEQCVAMQSYQVMDSAYISISAERKNNRALWYHWMVAADNILTSFVDGKGRYVSPVYTPHSDEKMQLEMKQIWIFLVYC